MTKYIKDSVKQLQIVKTYHVKDNQALLGHH